MRNIIYLIVILLLLSCSTSKVSTNYKYEPNNKSDLEAYWNIYSGTWSFTNNVINGIGDTFGWSILKSSEKLPRNYKIELNAKFVEGSLLELMLNFNKNRYIRAYLYEIQQEVIIGKGYFNRFDEERPGGGPSLYSKPIEIKYDEWYNIKIEVLNNNLTITINNSVSLSCSFSEHNLSKKGCLGLLTNGNIEIKDLVIESIK
jgi:hypothetical protein